MAIDYDSSRPGFRDEVIGATLRTCVQPPHIEQRLDTNTNLQVGPNCGAKTNPRTYSPDQIECLVENIPDMTQAE